MGTPRHRPAYLPSRGRLGAHAPLTTHPPQTGLVASHSDQRCGRSCSVAVADRPVRISPTKAKDKTLTTTDRVWFWVVSTSRCRFQAKTGQPTLMAKPTTSARIAVARLDHRSTQAPAASPARWTPVSMVSAPPIVESVRLWSIVAARQSSATRATMLWRMYLFRMRPAPHATRPSPGEPEPYQLRL